MTEREFISKWIGTIQKTMRKFPQDFIKDIPSSTVKLPGSNLVPGEELFGRIEITDSSGKSLFFVDNALQAKYYLYGARNNPAEIDIPDDFNESEKLIKLYEKEMDDYLKEIESDYYQNFPGQKNCFHVSNEIFRSLNLIRY